MSKLELPKTDSIRELAYFWDQHDITDFEDSLEEVKESLFNKGKGIHIHLKQDEFDSIEKLARQRGLEKDDLHYVNGLLKNLMQHNIYPV